MKKNLLILAAAALAFAACSNDETIAVNQGDAIVFRPVVDRTTRSATAPADADDNGSTAPTEFNITAWVNDNSSDATHEYSGTPYINNVTYHNNSGTYYVSDERQKVVTVTGATKDVSSGTEVEFIGTPNTGMNAAQTIYFIGLIILLCGVGIVYANARPVKSKQQ